MTIEIRELVIEARVSAPPVNAPLTQNKSVGNLTMSEEQLIRHIQQQVMRQVSAWLRDELRGLR